MAQQWFETAAQRQQHQRIEDVKLPADRNGNGKRSTEFVSMHVFGPAAESGHDIALD